MAREQQVFDPVFHLRALDVVAQNVLVDAVPPRDVFPPVAAPRVLHADAREPRAPLLDGVVQLLQIADVPRDLFFGLEKTLRDHAPRARANEPREVVEVVFGMVLHEPRLDALS